jgi:hypothetical protein
LRCIRNAIALETNGADGALIVAHIGDTIPVYANSFYAISCADGSLHEPIGNALAFRADLANRAFDRCRDTTDGWIALVDRAEIAVLAIEVRRAMLLADPIRTRSSDGTTRTRLATATSASRTDTPAFLAIAGARTAVVVIGTWVLIPCTDAVCSCPVQPENRQHTSRCASHGALKKLTPACVPCHFTSETIEPITFH